LTLVGVINTRLSVEAYHKVETERVHKRR
jgi:hypothetical protein